MNTKFLKKRALRLFFAAEIIVFVSFYFFGPHGIQHLMMMQAEQKKLDEQIIYARNDIEQLDTQLAQFKKTPFFKEKVAREQLQMACEGDEIYYVR